MAKKNNNEKDKQLKNIVPIKPNLTTTVVPSLQPVEEKIIPTKKDERQARREQRVSEMVSTQASRYGLDLANLPKAPLTEDAKKRITEGVSQSTADDFTSEIEGFAKAYSKPSMITTPELSEEQLKQSARKQRKARWLDALYGFGEGLQGRTADPRAMVGKRLQRERGETFQEYRSLTEQNKKAQEIWENQYRNDLIKFVDDKIKDKSTSTAEKAKYKQFQDQLKLQQDRLQLSREELEARKAGKYYAPRSTSAKAAPIYTEQIEGGAWQITNAKNPYSDLYYKLTGNSPAVINEMAKIAGHTTEEDGTLKRNLSADEIERFSNTLLSRMFTVSTDEDGNRIATPKPGMENYLGNLSNKIADVKRLETEIQNTAEEQMLVTKDARRREKTKLNLEFDSKLNDLESQLDNAQSEIKNLLDGKQATSKSNPIQPKSDDIIDKWFK
ncbi:hypothetical protein KAR91_73315 [Candidatus Pacearchaeota archaeon]|nr:hypothetical protein [Candidatus Pacearchaeota archaeon]